MNLIINPTGLVVFTKISSVEIQLMRLQSTFGLTNWFFILSFFPIYSCSGGELFHECVIEESFKESDVVRLLGEILDGVLFLHHKNILHLDLKVSTHDPHPILKKKKKSPRILGCFFFFSFQCLRFLYFHSLKIKFNIFVSK